MNYSSEARVYVCECRWDTESGEKKQQQQQKTGGENGREENEKENHEEGSPREW